MWSGLDPSGLTDGKLVTMPGSKSPMGRAEMPQGEHALSTLATYGKNREHKT